VNIRTMATPRSSSIRDQVLKNVTTRAEAGTIADIRMEMQDTVQSRSRASSPLPTLDTLQLEIKADLESRSRPSSPEILIGLGEIVKSDLECRSRPSSPADILTGLGSEVKRDLECRSRPGSPVAMEADPELLLAGMGEDVKRDLECRSRPTTPADVLAGLGSEVKRDLECRSRPGSPVSTQPGMLLSASGEWPPRLAYDQDDSMAASGELMSSGGANVGLLLSGLGDEVKSDLQVRSRPVSPDVEIVCQEIHDIQAISQIQDIQAKLGGAEDSSLAATEELNASGQVNIGALLTGIGDEVVSDLRVRSQPSSVASETAGTLGGLGEEIRRDLQARSRPSSPETAVAGEVDHQHEHQHEQVHEHQPSAMDLLSQMSAQVHGNLRQAASSAVGSPVVLLG